MHNIDQVRLHPAYKQLSAERFRLGVSLAAIMAAIYFSYILTIAFWPEGLGAQLSPDTVMTWGLLVGIAVIASGFLLTALYVTYANSRFDVLAARLKADVQ